MLTKRATGLIVGSLLAACCWTARISQAAAICGEQSGEAAAAATVWHRAEAQCPCMDGVTRAEFKSCLKRVIKDAVESDGLTESCETLLRR